MAKLKPWYQVVTPREDLREGRPLDASEFAVHLDQVRDGRAKKDYQNPEVFFEKTYLTKNLKALAGEVVRRLSGVQTEASAIFNLATQFGGGKTHALTLLYHLADQGDAAKKWRGVDSILKQAGVDSIPKAATAVFVGTEFDSVKGRGGEDGIPLRKTPWGEIAYQLGGKDGFELIEEHEDKMIAPGGDVIRKMLPKDKPCLILMDELMNYFCRFRKSGLSAQFYNFLHNLSETARGENNVVLAVSIPASELEMTAEDEADFNRIKKLLDRLGKPIVMSAESETSEIIRRRLFEWFGLPDDAKKVAADYSDWFQEHRNQLPQWFPIDNARQAIQDSYPFHPSLLSVFERKWQSLPRFQQTRGVLRLLALWVSRAYMDGFKGAHKDLLIGLGTAPFDDPFFRSAIFEQMGENKLEGAVTTDICGKADSHAARLDKESGDAIKKARLHQKCLTSIFFESNGGQTKDNASTPEIRLAVGEPDLDIGNIETALETLGSTCYYLTMERTYFRFSLSPNLNKLLADKTAVISPDRIAERIKFEIKKVFALNKGVQICLFPKKSGDIPDRPILSFIVLDPEQSFQENTTPKLIEGMTKEYGSSARTYKSALVWILCDDVIPLKHEARISLALEDIRDEGEHTRLDVSQQNQLAENIKKSKRNLIECVWRSYRHIALLDKSNTIQTEDLGLIHSSAADSLVEVVLSRLEQKDEIQKGVSPNFLVRNWPPAFIEWSTKSVRDAFFSSPLFPRLLNGDVIKDTLAKGVSSGILAYVGKTSEGRYEPFIFNEPLPPMEVEISDDVFIITAEEAKKHLIPPYLKTLQVLPDHAQIMPNKKLSFGVKGLDQHGREFKLDNIQWSSTGGTIDQNGVFKAGAEEGSYLVTASFGDIKGYGKIIISTQKTKVPETPVDGIKTTKISWRGEIPPQKWMNFYTKVLSKFTTEKSFKLFVEFEISSQEGISEQKTSDTKTALHELGLNDNIVKE